MKKLIIILSILFIGCNTVEKIEPSSTTLKQLAEREQLDSNDLYYVVVDQNQNITIIDKNDKTTKYECENHYVAISIIMSIVVLFLLIVLIVAFINK